MHLLQLAGRYRFGHHARAHPPRPATLANALHENRTAALLALGLVLLAVVLTLL